MNRIKEVLEKKRIKQKWLAQELGKSYNMVNSYVQNRRQPSIAVLYEIADIVNVDIASLLIDKKKNNIIDNKIITNNKEENISSSIYTNFTKIKRYLGGDKSNFNLFVYFLFVDELCVYFDLNESEKKAISNTFNLPKLSFSNSIKRNAKCFKVELEDRNLQKISELKHNFFSVTNFEVKNLSPNKILGFLTEKIITKKETGAYYTTFETTDYIVCNSVLPQIIYKWSKINEKLNEYLSSFEISNGITFVEKSIKDNILYENFIRLEKKFNAKNHLTDVIKNIKIIDISCGSGSFIFGVVFFLYELKKRLHENISLDFSNVFGIDIDQEAILIIKSRLLLERYISNENQLDLNLDNFIVGNVFNNKKVNKLFKNKFDIVLGNPPYIELRKIDYKIDNYITKKCNNIYALFLEKSLYLLNENGHMGMIVPISYISTKRMNPVRGLLREKSKYEFCSSYADRPSCLFNGVHQKLNIILLQKSSSSIKKNLYTSSYYHWYKNEKHELFKSIRYTKNNFYNINYYYKIGNSIEKNIISKLISSNISLLDNVSKDIKAKHKVWVNMRLCFWNKSFLSEQKSNEYKQFLFDKQSDAIIFSALINSNLFFFFWECISDAWHITSKDLNNLKIDFSKFTSSDRKKISDQYFLFETSIDNNKTYIGSKQTTFAFQHKKDKILIDQLDHFFAKMFKLSKQELFYLRDYQLKYRMNNELNNYLNNRVQ